jgi:hypothetical protein
MLSKIAPASSDRRSAAIALLFCALLSRTAYAQTQSEAAKIIQSFGSGGTLSRDGMKRYLISLEFRKIDADKSGSLDADEYMAAQLYARGPDCGNEKAHETWLAESEQGPVDADRLYTGNPMWKTHVDETVDAHWKRASPQGEALDETGVEAYLAGEHARRERIPTAVERLTALTAGSQTDVTIPQFDTFFTSEWFGQVDADGSGALTFVEFTRTSKYLTAALEFCGLAGSDGLVTRADIADPVKMEDEAPALQIQLVRSANRQRLAVSPLPRVPVQTVKAVFEQQEKDAAAEAALGALGAKGFVPDGGLLFMGTRRVTDAGDISWDQDQPAAFLRIIKDFTVDDPLQAEPALFTIAHERGQETTVAIDGTVQVDFYPASFTVLRAAAGVDIERRTGSEGSNIQTYYGTLHLFLWHRGWLESSSIRFAPNLEDNRTKKITTVAGDLLWQPGLKFGHFSTNQWLPAGNNTRFFVTPRAALELGEVTRSPEGSDEPAVTNVRMELVAGLAIGSRTTATYRGLQRFGAGDSNYQEVSLRWSFDEYDRFSLKTSFADGRKTTTADDEQTFSMGIGVKF